MPSFMMHPNFGGYAAEFSPWGGGLLAVCAAECFGVQGSGKLYILNTQGQGPVKLEAGAATADGCFDAAWSELAAHHVVVGCGDGNVLLWDLRTIGTGQPQAVMRHSQGEVYSCHWNQVSKQVFATGCWNREIKIWNAQTCQPVRTYQEHMKELYCVKWSPKNNDMMASCSGDGMFKVWDARQPKSLLSHPGHGGEIILSCDWNKYDPNVLVTSGVDRMVKMWDIRRPQQPLLLLRGHQSAVRTVKCSPHSRNLILSGGYDFQLCLFDTARQQPLSQRYVQHKEFIVGLDFALDAPGVVASTGWDCLTYTWTLGKPVVATHQAQAPLPQWPIPPKLPRPPVADGPVQGPAPPPV
eukprot:TRINITY_DN32974_c0_g1_i1.p2 TRINITY_DN32974_c0_g1~~TRINITY_DN32974_c0_g1_i1.p2  ORF type:complete len:354 (+),score=98.90 TRINITY_DN32974_c0_g1_i1:76-1137(+)